MNLILFERDELTRPLPATDPRTRHVRQVLRRRPGDWFDCGLVDGPPGRARIEQDDTRGLHLSFVWHGEPPPLAPLWLLVGLPRPQTARRILHEAAALGVAGLRFFPTYKGEPSYAASSLWQSGEARRHLLAGVAQAFSTRLPDLAVVDSLATAVAADAFSTRVALDNYEAAEPLAHFETATLPAALAIGPERGWSAQERNALRAAGFTLTHLGPRVLRTETACVAGLTLLQAHLGLH